MEIGSMAVGGIRVISTGFPRKTENLALELKSQVRSGPPFSRQT